MNWIEIEKHGLPVKPGMRIVLNIGRWTIRGDKYIIWAKFYRLAYINKNGKIILCLGSQYILKHATHWCEVVAGG